MKNVGIVGWRGMVGSVLLNRMKEEGDFDRINPFFFSSSQAGKSGPKINGKEFVLNDAHSLEHLKEMDIVISCQGGEYTKDIHSKLRSADWTGYWIDAASSLRMNANSIIVLDPINKLDIEKGLNFGIKDYCGGNCTVSLMLMGIGSLFKEGIVEWMTSSTYQAASGGGARHMKELLSQMDTIGDFTKDKMDLDILSLDSEVSNLLNSGNLDTQCFGNPLALNLIPWIDSPEEQGQTREEWKARAETNKILGNIINQIPIDGTCVRVGALRSHSQALTVKLNKTIDIETINDLISSSNPWVELVENTQSETVEKLCPRYVSGTLKTVVGRVRKLNIGDDYLNIFTVGDQLLWGAAEPLRRAMNMML